MEIDNFPLIAKNLKEARQKIGISLSEASELTGVSKTMLSQIERGESIPTLSTVWKISNGLKIRFEKLVSARNDLYDVKNVRENKPIISDEKDVYIYNMLSFSPHTGLEIYYGEFCSGCDYHSVGHLNGKYEYCFVISGEVEILVENDAYSLKEGDFIIFDSYKEHRYINNKDNKAILYMIVNYE